jgi:hypothetical protein
MFHRPDLVKLPQFMACPEIAQKEGKNVYSTTVTD